MTKVTLKDGATITITESDNPTDPREYDNLAVFCCFHRRYTLGDSRPTQLARGIDASTPGELRDLLAEPEKNGIVLVMPLYMYEHSGIDVKTEGSPARYWQHAGWDSGLLGVAVVTEECLKVMGRDNDLQALRKSVIGEVEEWASYLRGERYDAMITYPDGSTDWFCDLEYEDLIKYALENWGYTEADVVSQED